MGRSGSSRCGWRWATRRAEGPGAGLSPRECWPESSSCRAEPRDSRGGSVDSGRKSTSPAGPSGRKNASREAHASRDGHSRQRPTLPRRCHRSTIGPGGLNDRVRNGNGCGPSGIATGNTARVLDIGIGKRPRVGCRGRSGGGLGARDTQRRDTPAQDRGADSRTRRFDRTPAIPGQHLAGSVQPPLRRAQALARLVPVGSTPLSAYTSGLSTWSSPRGLTRLTRWETSSWGGLRA